MSGLCLLQICGILELRYYNCDNVLITIATKKFQQKLQHGRVEVRHIMLHDFFRSLIYYVIDKQISFSL